MHSTYLEGGGSHICRHSISLDLLEGFLALQNKIWHTNLISNENHILLASLLSHKSV